LYLKIDGADQREKGEKTLRRNLRETKKFFYILVFLISADIRSEKTKKKQI
jgi:hypothetical protein